MFKWGNSSAALSIYGANTLSSNKPMIKTSFKPLTLDKASRWWEMIGRPATGKRGLGVLRERGLKRVPLEGPPTRITALDSDITVTKTWEKETTTILL